MKKIISLLAIIMFMGICVTTVFAKNNDYRKQHHNEINHDTICDDCKQYFIDENNDGICDNPIQENCQNNTTKYSVNENDDISDEVVSRKTYRHGHRQGHNKRCH